MPCKKKIKIFIGSSITTTIKMWSYTTNERLRYTGVLQSKTLQYISLNALISLSN